MRTHETFNWITNGNVLDIPCVKPSPEMMVKYVEDIRIAEDAVLLAKFQRYLDRQLRKHDYIAWKVKHGHLPVVQPRND